jgi:methyl-accepting chemotaxis protein
MISKLHQLNLHDKIKYIYATVIKFMILSGIVSIIGLSLLDIRFNSYVKGAQKANNAAKESIIDISSAARNIREMALNDDSSLMRIIRIMLRQFLQTPRHSLIL